MISRRSVLFAAAAAPAALRASAGWASATVQPYALEDFYAEPEVSDAALSPKGDRIALLTRHKKGALVHILDANNPTDVLRRIETGLDVSMVEWASETRLLLRTLIKEKLTGLRSYGDIKKPTLTFARVLTIGDDGSNPVFLFGTESRTQRHVLDLASVIDMLPEDPRNVLMSAWSTARDAPALFRVDVHTGGAELVEAGSPSTAGWGVQNGVAVLRRDLNSRGDVETWYARAPGESEWKRLRRTRVRERPDFVFLSAGREPGTVLVAARVEGEDTLAVRTLDLASLSFGPPLYRRDARDVDGAVFDDRRRLVAVRYTDDRAAYDFADKTFTPHFKAMQAFVGAENSIGLFDVDDTHGRFLALVSGPREPGAFFFYDRKARRVENLGSAYSNLSPERLGEARALTVRTRDGAEIPAYLTAPPGGGAGPLVVLVHGGPEQRDTLDWSRDVQVLAAQGWWVLQPNFRGSGGYGEAFAAAGHRRWGDRMQEDVEDAVAQVLAAGKADPRRVAIMGASYGGYAALMGAVRQPKLYRAAVSIVGVTDLPEMLDHDRRLEGADSEVYQFWVKRIGDPRADKAALQDASPRRRAAEIRAPVLLIHGVDDQIVPVEQSRMMAKALKAAGKPHELIEVEDAGHADWEEEEERRLMTKTVAFLRAAFA